MEVRTTPLLLLTEAMKGEDRNFKMWHDRWVTRVVDLCL